MSKKLFGLFLIFSLSVFLTGCVNNMNDTSDSSSNTGSVVVENTGTNENLGTDEIKNDDMEKNVKEESVSEDTVATGETFVEEDSIQE